MRSRSLLAPALLLLAVTMAASLFVRPATALVVYDHLACYKFKDLKLTDGSNKPLKAQMTMSQFNSAAFPDEVNCEIKVKAKHLCVPADETVDVYNGTLNTGVEGPDLEDSYLCYKAKCKRPKEAPVPPTDVNIEDPFAARQLTKQKMSVVTVCKPAVVVVPTTTTITTTTTLSTDCSPCRAFVTSDIFPANLGSVGAYDQKCNQAATNASLGGDWVAWISDSTQDARQAITVDGPFHLLDGTQIAADKVDLLDGVLDVALNMDETMTLVTAPSARTWTGTDQTGVFSGLNCEDWSSASSANTGTEGRVDQNDHTWTEGSAAGLCDQEYRLYCIEVSTTGARPDFGSGNGTGGSVIGPAGEREQPSVRPTAVEPKVQ